MSDIFLIVHRFLDCSYHDNAYATSRALHIVDLVNPSDTFTLLEAFFEHQVIRYCLVQFMGHFSGDV